jgi:hypothetical protein
VGLLDHHANDIDHSEEFLADHKDDRQRSARERRKAG